MELITTEKTEKSKHGMLFGSEYPVFYAIMKARIVTEAMIFSVEEMMSAGV